jgi:hypothetical protein
MSLDNQNAARRTSGLKEHSSLLKGTFPKRASSRYDRLSRYV